MSVGLEATNSLYMVQLCYWEALTTQIQITCYVL